MTREQEIEAMHKMSLELIEKNLEIKKLKNKIHILNNDRINEDKIYQANIKLQDENKWLKFDLERLENAVDEVIELIKEKSTKEVADLYIEIINKNRRNY